MTHKTTEMRRKMKLEDPGRYQLYLQKSRERNKKNRSKLKEVLRKKTPEKDFDSKIQHKYNKSQTLQNVQAKREYNRKKKQEERARQTYKKQNWIREKDRERKKEKRDKLKAETTPEAPGYSLPEFSFTETESSLNSKTTKWNVKSQICSKIQGTPQKSAKVLDNVVQNSIPKEGLQFCCKCKKHRLSIKGKHTRFRTASNLVKRSLRKRSSRIDVIGIQKFYLREDISQMMPYKSNVTKEGSGYIMQVPVSSAHLKYLSENKAKPQISLEKFASLREKRVRKLTISQRNYCCCVYCMNIRYKLLTLSREVSDTTKKKIHEGDLLDIVLCPKADYENFHDPKCINGSCDKCSDYTKTLKEFYNSIGNQQLYWNRREKSKGKDGKEKGMVTKTGKKEDLLMELVSYDIKNPSQGTTFFKHYFSAKWQSMQFQQMKTNLSDDNVLQVMDLANNREIRYRNYTSNRVTLNLIVNFYKTDRGLVRDSLVIISGDPKHDYHAVKYYLDLVKNHIYEQIRRPLNRFLVWGEDIGSQYKSKGPFADLESETYEVNRNYFGLEHGERECDAEIREINQAINRAILDNKVTIDNAEDMFMYCKNHLEFNEALTKRKFLFVKENEIHRDRHETQSAKGIPNLQQYHQIRNSKLHKNFEVRHLSCLCKMCESGKDGKCLNKKYVQPYELKEIQLNDKEQKTKRIPQSDPKVADKFEENSQMKSEFKNFGHNESTSDEEGRSKFFASKLKSFARCQIYNELVKEVEKASREIVDKFGEIEYNNDVNLFDQHLIEDANTAVMMHSITKFLPKELHGRIPVEVLGDGNCLPRSGSVLAFGNETRYIEMRCRIVMELVRNKDIYLNLSHIKQCIDPNSNEVRHLLKTYCMFSAQYVQGTRTMRSTIVNVFEKEVMSICVDKTFMGIWQIFALSSLIHCRIFSVYPDSGSKICSITLNRLVEPIENRHGNVLAGIVWTSTRNDMTDRNWIPNHFVPLIPDSKRIDIEAVDVFDHHDAMDTSVDYTATGGITRSLIDSPDVLVSELPTYSSRCDSSKLTRPNSVMTEPQPVYSVVIKTPAPAQQVITVPSPQQTAVTAEPQVQQVQQMQQVQQIQQLQQQTQVFQQVLTPSGEVQNVPPKDDRTSVDYKYHGSEFDSTSPSTLARSLPFISVEKPSNASFLSQTIEGGAGWNQPHENCKNRNFESTDGGFSSINQQGNLTTCNHTYEVQQRFEGSQFSKPNIKAVEYSRNSFPRHTILNLQTFEKLGSSNCSKLNDLIMPTHITNPSTEIKQHDKNVSCISNCQATPETASCIVNPPHLIANGEAIDLRQKIYTCSDVGDMNSIFGSTSLVTGGTSDITSYNNHQQHGDSEFSMPSTNKVEYFQNSLSICSGSNIQSIGDSRYDHFNNIDGVKISDTYPSYTYNLIGSSRVSVEDKNKSTVLGEHPFEIKNNKKMVFTKLKVKRVSKKNVRLSSDACVDKPSITGCVFMPDERVVLCDYSNRKLRLLDKSFKLEDSLELPSQVWCISVVNDTTVIITLPYKEQLQYIEVSPRLKSGRVLQLDKHCWGVHVVGSDTYVTCFSILNTEFSDRELRILDKDGNLMHSLDMNKNNEFMFKYPDYLAISARSGKIYVSDRGTDTVTCLTSDGTVVFQYEDPELTSSGLCVDDEDNVIVCGSYNTHIVTSDGKKSSVIPTDNDDIEYDNDDIEYPHSIAYRRTDRTLIVGCRDNESLFVVSCAEK